MRRLLLLGFSVALVAACPSDSGEDDLSDAGGATAAADASGLSPDAALQPGPDASAPPAGPVVMQNLQVALVEKTQCMRASETTLGDCGVYQFTFTLRNDSQLPVEQREFLRIVLGNVEIRDNALCRGTWAVAAQSVSPVITVVFDSDGGSQDGNWPALAYTCTSGLSTPEFPNELDRAPYSGPATLEVQGLMSDGSPFSTSQTVALVDRS